MKILNLKGQGNYWALVCDCGVGKNRWLICGVYPSRKEAIESNKEVKDCVAKHYIKKCEVKIRLMNNLKVDRSNQTKK